MKDEDISFVEWWYRMILSASRRTDIPSYYSDWFFNRINEGFIFVRNPVNIHQISRISLSPDLIDCIVFWSKNPKPMLEKLGSIKEYPFYFQFTLTSYLQDMEIGLPDKFEIIDTFKRLADEIGANRVIWRYDPILLNDKYTISYHLENFEKIAHYLNGYTEKVTISFLDFYNNITKNIKIFNIKQTSIEEKVEIAKKLSAIAQKNRLLIDTCAEDIDLSQYGINHARCIDDKLIERIINCTLEVGKDKNQRSECGCVTSIDIGEYNSCSNGCLYCYANNSRSRVMENRKKHKATSPLLIVECGTNDAVKDRSIKSNKNSQQSLFNSKNDPKF